MTVKPIPDRDSSKYAGQYAAAFDPLRLAQIFSDSYRIALTSKNPATARDRFELAVEAYHQIMSMSIAGEVRASVTKDMSLLANNFDVQVIINEANSLRDKARKLKTAGKQIELLRQALDILARGVSSNPGSESLASSVAEARAELEKVQPATASG